MEKMTKWFVLVDADIEEICDTREEGVAAFEETAEFLFEFFIKDLCGVEPTHEQKWSFRKKLQKNAEGHTYLMTKIAGQTVRLDKRTF